MLGLIECDENFGLLYPSLYGFEVPGERKALALTTEDFLASRLARNIASAVVFV